MIRQNRQRLICVFLFCSAILLFVAAVTFLVLAVLGVIADLWGLIGLLAIPVGCASLFVSLMSGISAEDSRPSVMQMFASGGRN